MELNVHTSDNVMQFLQSTVKINTLEKKEERITCTLPQNFRCTIQLVSHEDTGLFALPSVNLFIPVMLSK